MKNQEPIAVCSEHMRAAFILDTNGQCYVYTYCTVFPRTIDSRQRGLDDNTPCIQPSSTNVQRRYRVLSTYLGIGD